MLRARRGLLAALATALLLGVGAGIGAGALSVSERSFRATWSRLTLVLSGVEQSVTCPVTLEGSFHSATFTQSRGAPLGKMLRATTGSCTGGALTIDNESLPWAFDYLSTLISPPGFSASLFSMSLRLQVMGQTCPGSIAPGQPLEMRFQYDGAGRATALIDHAGSTVVPRFPSCTGLQITLEGSAPLTRAGGTSAVSIRLI